MNPEPASAASSPTEPTRVVAVIDIGATAIRLRIAEIGPQGTVRPLESLQRAVQLGKDTFTRGHIEPATIEACVKVLQSFRRVMKEYGVNGDENIRAVATSAVREAENRDAFLDRIYMATHFNVEAIQGAEENRLTYIAVHDIFQGDTRLRDNDAVIIEVGGGSTEMIFVREGRVTFARNLRLGSLRMRERLETHHASTDRLRAVLEQHIKRTVDQVYWSVAVEEVPYMVAMSGDMRFAASLSGHQDKNELFQRIDLRMLASLTERLVAMPVDELVRRYRLAYQEAETIGPALLSYENLARAFHVKEILVAQTSLRDGLLREMAVGGAWTLEFAEQAVHAAVLLARKYSTDQEHSLHVAELCVQLFRELKAEHGLESRFELHLKIAALLHEVGMFIGDQSHHKHSMYIIQNSELFGLTKKDTTLIALVARYHRRAVPRPYHLEYHSLDREDRLVVSKLAAILRVADALDRKHTQQLRKLSFRREQDLFVIMAHGVADLTLEQLALKEKGDLFEQLFGMKVAALSAFAKEGVDAGG